jgi:hypothetical protein
MKVTLSLTRFIPPVAHGNATATAPTPVGVFDEEGDRDMLFNLATAFLGFEAAVSLRDFVEKYEWQVTIEDILDAGDLSKCEKWGINDHAAMIEKFEASEVFKEDLTEDQIQTSRNTLCLCLPRWL